MQNTKYRILSAVLVTSCLLGITACAKSEKEVASANEPVKKEVVKTSDNSGKKETKKQTASELKKEDKKDTKKSDAKKEDTKKSDSKDKKVASAKQTKQESKKTNSSKADKPATGNSAGSGNQATQKPVEKPSAPQKPANKPAEPAPAPAPTPEPPKEPEKPAEPPHEHSWQAHTATRPVKGPYGTYRTDTWEQIDHLIAAAAAEWETLSEEDKAACPRSRYIGMKCPWGTFTGSPVIGEETYTDYTYCTGCGARQ